MCTHKPPIIPRDNGPDTLDSTPQKVTLRGRNGPDLLRGFAGDDTLAGGRGRDTCRGGTGTDKFFSCEIRFGQP